LEKTQVQVRFTQEMLDQLDAEAKGQVRSRSSLIVWIITQYFKNKETN
jgi:metal-responsive CopG/Arc/MetJ family transcriptional regulator